MNILEITFILLIAQNFGTASFDSFFNGGDHSKDHPVVRLRQEKPDKLYSPEDVWPTLLADTDILSETEAIEISDRIYAFNLECTAFYPITWSFVQNSKRSDDYRWDLNMTNLHQGWPAALGRGNYSSILRVQKLRGGGFPGEYIPICHGIGETGTNCPRTTVVIQKGTDWRVADVLYDRIYNFTVSHSCQLCGNGTESNSTTESHICPVDAPDADAASGTSNFWQFSLALAITATTLQVL